MILSTTLLNQDVKNKCELFHRSQPVNVWKLTASRFLAGIGGMVALSLALGLINFLVINVIVSVTTPLRLDWWLAINGFFLSWLHMSIVLLVSGSMGYLLSAVFRDNAMGKGILGIAGIEIVIRALNGFYKTGLPSLVENLFKLIMSGLSQFQNAVTVMKYGSLSFYSPGTGTSSNISIGGVGHAANSFQMPVSFTGNLWATLFTWDIVFKLLLCVGLYALATYIYHKREVQF
jgi:hypothetical protein